MKAALTVYEIVRRLNELADTEEVKQLKPKQVFDWLEENGFVYSFENPDANKKNRRATGQGRSIGFYEEHRVSVYGYKYYAFFM